MDGAEADICVSYGTERGGEESNRGGVFAEFCEIVQCSTPPHPRTCVLLVLRFGDYEMQTSEWTHEY